MTADERFSSTTFGTKPEFNVGVTGSRHVTQSGCVTVLLKGD